MLPPARLLHRAPFSWWLLFLGLILFARGTQAADRVWSDVREERIVSARKTLASRRTVIPNFYRPVLMDHPRLEALLRSAPRERTAEAGTFACELELPMPDGSTARFRVEESPIMEDALAAKYPQLKTFVAYGIDDPRLFARLDLTPRGFHAIILSGSGSVYIDPYWSDSTVGYLSYQRKDYTRTGTPFHCLNSPAEQPSARATGTGMSPGVIASNTIAKGDAVARPTGATLRTFRLAVGTTGEYTAAVGGGTVLGGLGAVITSVNRVNALYQRDFVYRMVLVANEDVLIYTDSATDGYTNSSPNSLLSENQAKMDSIIGTANYDIGHVFSTGGGGLAALGVVGDPSSKAKGETGTSNPVGDPYDIDYVAHEMGHQFGANHTFNGNTGSCQGNRNPGTACEPGSGTTIMAYAGICSPQDLAPHSDDYFHSASYEEIDSYIATVPTAGSSSSTGNTAPTVFVPANVTIPCQTPFTLTGSASDPNGSDVLTYCWEAMDHGPGQDPTASPRDNGSSALFRSFAPTNVPSRTFPSLQYILSNSNIPPATISSYISGEYLPTTSRTMAFRLTVRDNAPGGGGSNYGSMNVTSVSTAGPFTINSFNAATTLAAGSTLPISWSVANTDISPISCSGVKISFSTDGGVTFPYVLAASTANNGSANVTLPATANIATTQGRFKIQAVGNIFFDISDANVTVTSTNSAPVLAITGAVTVKRGAPTPVTAAIANVSGGVPPYSVSLSNVPAQSTVTANVSGTVVTATALADCTLVTTLTSRNYPIGVAVTDSLGATVSGNFNLTVTPNTNPTVGNYAAVQVGIGTTGTNAPSAGASDADGNLGATPYSVEPNRLPGGGTISVNQATGAVVFATTAATSTGTTPVRVTVQDLCGAAVVRSFNVATLYLNALPAADSIVGPSSENFSPANNAIDPGETVTLNFKIRNIGAVPTSNLVATLQSSGGVTPVTQTSAYGVIGASGTGSQPFILTASGNCGGNATATLHLQDGATDFGTLTFNIPLGVTVSGTTASQNFDGLTAPALPPGWSSSAGSGSPTAWATSTTSPDTAPICIAATTTSSVSDNRLTSPSIPITGTTALVSFRHRWNTESGYDGGVLEIAIGAGAYTDILSATGAFVTGGYTGSISPDFSSPIAGRNAWTGSANASYTTTTVRLPAAAAGQNVRLRFRLASDSSTSVTGAIWRIDSISLLDSTSTCVAATAPVITSSVPPGTATVDVLYSYTLSGTGNPPPSFLLTSGALPPGLTLSGLQLSGTPTTPGVYTGLVLTASNGTLPNPTQSFTITVADTFSHFMSTFGLSPQNAAPEADPLGQGIPNLLSYALNLPLNGPRQGGLPVASVKSYSGTQYLSLRFTRMSTATDLRYAVQVSPDLVTWTDVAASTGGAAMSGPGFVAETGTAPALMVECRDTVPVDLSGTSRRYIRLRVTKP